MRQVGANKKHPGRLWKAVMPPHSADCHAARLGGQLWVSAWQDLHHAYKASYITSPCPSISWSSLKFFDKPRDSA